MDFTIFLTPMSVIRPHFAVANSNLYEQRYQIERYRIQLKRRSISEKRHTTFNRLDNEVSEADSGFKKWNTATAAAATAAAATAAAAPKKIYRSTTCQQKYQTRR